MKKRILSKQNRLIEHFFAGTTAWTAAALAGVNKSTSAMPIPHKNTKRKL